MLWKNKNNKKIAFGDNSKVRFSVVRKVFYTFLHHKKGQSVVEMALFAGLILAILGSLISYLQSGNERQYVQMESFRQALERACNYRPDTGGAGAAVDITLKQDRRLVNLSGNYKKGTVQPFFANSSIFWSVPYVAEGIKTVSLADIRVNEDQYEAVKGEDYKSFTKVETEENDSVEETLTKEESAQEIVNTSQSKLEDTLTTKFIYDPADDEGAEEGAQRKAIWEVTQGAYRDSSDGQYKFDDAKVGTEIERGKTWRTQF